MEVTENNVALKIEDLHLSFGSLNALNSVNLEIKEGELLAIIGPNGAGKTSLINCISGFYRPQKGKIIYRGHNLVKIPPYKVASLGVSRTFQQIELFTGLSALDNIMAARHVFFKTGVLSGALYFGRAHSEEIKHRRVAEEIIHFLEMEAIRKKVVGMLPYGQRKKVELGRALALEPRLLLLDEPMAGMNLEEKEDMARYILDISEGKWTDVFNWKPTILLVEHDMGVGMDIANRVVVLDWGSIIADGPPEKIKVDASVIKAYLGEAV
jgi:branched-chain amino acid transport system ATP-binding protein